MASHGSTAVVVDIWKDANAPVKSASDPQLPFPMRFEVRVAYTLGKVDVLNTRLPFMYMCTVLLSGKVSIQWIHVPKGTTYPTPKLPVLVVTAPVELKEVTITLGHPSCTRMLLASEPEPKSKYFEHLPEGGLAVS